MSKVKAGDVLSCEVCGLAVIVDEECGCATIDLICCEEPMVNTGVSKIKTNTGCCGAEKKGGGKKSKSGAKKKPVAKKKIVKKTVKKAVKKTSKKTVKKAAKKK